MQTSKTRRRTIEIPIGDRLNNEQQQMNTSKSKTKQPQPDLVTISNAPRPASTSITTSQENRLNLSLNQLFINANLPGLIQLDSLGQIKYLLDERDHLIHQIELLRSQFEKQYSYLKQRLEENETENERLTNQHRSSSKELLLYKSLVEAPDNPDPSTKTKDYQQLKFLIEKIVKENERLNVELQKFKTTDPVYEQVQILERANLNLRQELKQSIIENTRLNNLINSDELKQMKIRLNQSLEECEQLKLINQRLLQQCQQQQTSSPKQIRIYPLSQQQPLSPISHRSSRPTPVEHISSDLFQLRDHVQHLEETLHKRDHELQKLQNEIEKGTTSIMSSIEDLYYVSSNVVSPTTHLHVHQRQPTIDDLQNELDQLHDKLDELLNENQILKTRTQEFDTIYEENEFLYAEKSQWNEEMERARVRQLVLEQEIQTLKEREKEFLNQNDTSVNQSNPSGLKLKIDVLKQNNQQLEAEVQHLRGEIDSFKMKFDQSKREFLQKEDHYKRIFEAAQNKQQIPQELVRIEKLNVQMENQFEEERQEYEKIILALEEQSEKREQKYGSLYDAIVKLQNDYRQRETEFMHQMDDMVKQRDQFQAQLVALQSKFDELQQDNQALKDEIKSNSNINRDLKSALTSTNNETQTQLRQWKSTVTEFQEKYEHDIAERNNQIEKLRAENKQLLINYDTEMLKARQTIIQLQHDNNQYTSQLERYRSNVGKLQVEIGEKRNFIEQVQTDLSERSTLQFSINHQLAQENKMKTAKIIELEQTLVQEQQRKGEFQRTIQELQMELLKSRSLSKESLEKVEELERRFHESDKNLAHLNETTEPTRRELHALRSELVSKSDQVTMLQHTIEDEKLKRQRLEMKLKRLKEEYITVRKELYHRVEENNTLQHELVGCRLKNDYYSQLSNQTTESIRSGNESESNTAVQLYLKEKAENQHCQLKCRTYQQKLEQLQKSYEMLKEKYKERLQQEREVFERAKLKYLDHIKNVQRDLHETRKLLEKDAELKMSQETAYQQLIDERRHLLTSMVEKDAKVREMRRENLLLLSKIQLLENQMEGLNDRVDRTLRERNQLRREINTVRLDTNVSIETSARASPVLPVPKTAASLDQSGWNQLVYHTESFGFNNGHPYEAASIT